MQSPESGASPHAPSTALPSSAVLAPRRERTLGERWQGAVRAVRQRFPPAFYLSLITVVAAGLLPAAITGEPLLNGWRDLSGSEIIVHFGLLVLFGLAAWALFKRRSSFFDFGLWQAEARPHRAVVFALSPPYPELKPAGGGGGGWTVGTVELTGTDLEGDIGRLEDVKRWPWQQLLRGLQPHADTVERVYLLGSSDSVAKDGKKTEGTHRYQDLAMEFLRGYLPGTAYAKSRPVDFDNMRAVGNALETALEWAMKPEPGNATHRLLKERDVVIDATGGLKPTSIAAAAMTLSTQVTFQYVHTETKEVIEYDLRHHGSSST